MTPLATYAGTYQGQEEVWDLDDFTVQIVENPIVNRTQKISSDVVTAQDAAARVADSLGGPLTGLFGKYCPSTVECGEDAGLLVAQAKFKCQIRASREPKPTKYSVHWYAQDGHTSS